MRLLIMDRPKGYTCRIRSTKTAEFEGREESLGADFLKVYRLLWMTKVTKLCYEDPTKY